MASASARGMYENPVTKDDPFVYMGGFNNRFASEAIPGALPIGQNTPQNCNFDLYSESLNGTGFIASRAAVQQVWLYRIMPGVAHEALSPMETSPDLEADFTLSNPKVHTTPVRLTWEPFFVEESASVDFVEGIKSVLGKGEPSMNEGVAVHVYACNRSMEKRAFGSNDGDMMILPVEGRLHIQTECGHLMVKPGEFAVVQKGHRFRVLLPDGASRGYIQEVYGVHYELPELGPIGTNGLALARDFQAPVASFDIDQTEWQLVFKQGGKLFQCVQDHTPFDVVAFHGNYVPYKYDIHRFVTIGVLDKDQMDPTIYCILTAKSKQDGIAIAEFNAFIPKWSVATNTYRTPYYHRHDFSEIGGMLYGPNRGVSLSSPGGITFQPTMGPHGNTEEEFQRTIADPNKPERVGEGMIGFMMHIGQGCTVTDFAMNRSKRLTIDDRKHWTSLKPNFLKNIETANAALRARGLPELVVPAQVAPVTKEMNGH